LLDFVFGGFAASFLGGVAVQKQFILYLFCCAWFYIIYLLFYFYCAEQQAIRRFLCVAPAAQKMNV